jgi:dolichol-phosphate mannosyltransferase
VKHSRNLQLIVIPVINEFENLKVLLPKILEMSSNADLLVIDDSSTDGTNSLIQEIQANFESRMLYILNQESLGIGGAHLQGLRFASKNNYELVATMDGDLTHDPSDIGRFIYKMNENPQIDLIIGSRFLRKSRINNWPFLRILLTYGGHLFTMITLQMREDLSSGLRIYRVNAIPRNLLAMEEHIGYEYFALSAYMYKLSNRKISEIDVILNPRRKGNSKLTLTKAVKSIKSTVRLRIFSGQLYLRVKD